MGAAAGAAAAAAAAAVAAGAAGGRFVAEAGVVNKMINQPVIKILIFVRLTNRLIDHLPEITEQDETNVTPIIDGNYQKNPSIAKL